MLFRSLIHQPHLGKAAALNRGIAEAREEIIIVIDADTIVAAHSVRALVAPFADPKVDAVCGNVQVGNAHSVLTAFQNFEYVTSQNYDRRAFDRFSWERLRGAYADLLLQAATAPTR